MKCILCENNKLSKEFPRDNISEECEHPTSCCLRCMIAHLKSQNVTCPHIGCQNKIIDCPKALKDYEIEMDQLYPPAEALDIEKDLTDATEMEKVINVTTLAGEKVTFAYAPQMTVAKLIEEIRKKMNVAEDKQQLVYKDTILEPYRNQIMAKLEDYNILPFATVHLMILLYAIPKNFNHVIFDLYWGYPASGSDYLDASCLLFSGKSLVSYVDYGNRSYNSNAIWHSGDVMDNHRRIGHHTIQVHLQNIPSSITHLYFTLSAWNSPTIAHYRNPSLKFFEASDKKKDLCKTTFTHACHSQAVIMCSVWRTSGGQWNIFESGKLSAGNAKNYNLLIKTIQSLP